jgi:hypothetical protein
VSSRIGAARRAVFGRYLPRWLTPGMIHAGSDLRSARVAQSLAERVTIDRQHFGVDGTLSPALDARILARPVWKPMHQQPCSDAAMPSVAALPTPVSQ